MIVVNNLKVEIPTAVKILHVDEISLNTPGKKWKVYSIKSSVYSLFSILVKFDYLLQFIVKWKVSKILTEVFLFKKALPSLIYSI